MMVHVACDVSRAKVSTIITQYKNVSKSTRIDLVLTFVIEFTVIESTVIESTVIRSTALESTVIEATAIESMVSLITRSR